MATTDIKEQFLGRFAKPLSGAARRRIVIWHDADAEFAEAFDELIAAAQTNEVAPDGRPVQFVKAEDGCMFALKKRIARDDTESDFAIYRQRPAGDIADDLLADIELYAEHFQADGLSLLVQDLGAADTREVRRELETLRPYFAAKDRVKRFVDLMPHAQNERDVQLGVLAAALGKVEPTANAVVRAYCVSGLQDAHDDASDATVSQLKRYGALDVLMNYVRGVTGFEGDVSDVYALMTHVLLSALSAEVPADVMRGLEGRYSEQHNDYCLGIVHDWQNASDEDVRALLADVTEQVEQDLRLNQRFVQASLDSLAQVDVFASVNRIIIETLSRSLTQGADRRAEVKALVGARSGLVGYEHFSCYFNALLAAAEILDFVREHVQGYHEAPAKRVWEAYTADWWHMDSAYRKFCEAWQNCIRDADADLVDVMQGVAEWVDNTYINGFLVPANECWVATAEANWSSQGYVEGVALQRRFFDEVVVNELVGAKRVVVIVSDALRYEVAKELEQELERSLRVECNCSAVQGQFPSVTPFGMAALLPNKTLSVDEESLAVLVDGAPTKTTAQRQAILQKRKPNSIALKATDVFAMKSAEQKEVARDAEVVYVYHDVIDATGESKSTAHDVFAACERAIEDIRTLTKVAINQFGASRIVVTADHGFLYTRQAMGEAEKVSFAEIEGEARELKERYAIMNESPQDDLLIKMSLATEDGSELVGLAPRGIVRLKRPGGASHYVHGGVSLEELCVPVLRIRHSGSRGKTAEAADAEIRFLDANRRVTSLSFRVRFYQPEPVSGKVRPATYELVMVDAAGNPVSDMRRAVADRADADESARVFEVRFALKEGRPYTSAEAFYLQARNVETGAQLFSERYDIDIAFAPAFDFGF